MLVLVRNILCPRRLAALATCVSLLAVPFEPGVAWAAAPESSNAEAEAMFRKGQAKYETADYNGAIDLWTEAYALVESTPETASIKALLLYNLAQAHVKAYELDEDPIHLKQAQQLLQSFRANLSLLYEDKAQLDEETTKVDEKLAEIDALLSASKPPQDEPPGDDEPPPPEVQPEPEPQPEGGRKQRTGKSLMIEGGVFLGGGVAFGALAIVGAVMGSGANDISDLDPSDLAGRENRFDTGRTGNILLIVGSVGAGLMIPIGAALIGVGAKKHGQEKKRASAMRLGPNFGSNGGGLTISGRF